MYFYLVVKYETVPYAEDQAGDNIPRLCDKYKTICGFTAIVTAMAGNHSLQ